MTGHGTTDPVGDMMGRMGETWSATNAMWSAVLDSWQAALSQRGAPAAQAVMERLLTPAAWPDGLAPLFEELAQILALPRFADFPAFDPKSLPSLAPAAELLAVMNQFALAAMPLWLRACQRFQAQAAALDSAGDALDAWNDALDRTLMEFNRSAEFAALQQRLLRAAMAQRQQTRRFGEQLAQTVDLPSRSELDDVYRRLHDLLRDVHGLKRELRALKRASATGASP